MSVHYIGGVHGVNCYEAIVPVDDPVRPGSPSVGAIVRASTEAERLARDVSDGRGVREQVDVAFLRYEISRRFVVVVSFVTFAIES